MREMPEERFAQIKAMKPATTPPHDVWTALQELIRDREHLVKASAEVAEELAQWTGELAR
ncbi:hypothetical protein OG292_19720 [Streptomyces sp. NBC_01511]|uniref:hypothetical protein n=1 Tax=Streptomyces sp. NBC_01511 TaxID=2903889 RepID=UPI00386FADD5